jgi:predicted nucleic acid-binding Zn ribbon protein
MRTGRAQPGANPLTEASVTYSSTTTGGKARPIVDSGPDQPADDPENEAVEPDEPDLARTALSDAQRIAKGRPRRSEAGRRRATRRENLAGRNRGGYSGPAPDDSDPQPVGGLLAGYIEERGWDRPLADARVFADWAVLVGSDVASHCAPVSLQNGELRVAAESTAWATQLRLLASTLLARLAAELGPETVRTIRITGPSGPSWKHGGFSVRGARGPRDTYG